MSFDSQPGTGEPQGPPSIEETLAQLLEEQKQHRAEVAALRAEIQESRAAPPRGVPAPQLSPEELYALRMHKIEQHPFYCLGCGLLHDYLHECTGRPEAPHPPILVISTDELKSENPSLHTAAPATDRLG